MQRYNPRKENSNWSESNKRRVRKLIELDLMTPTGMEKIEIAKRNGSWDRLNDIDREIVIELPAYSVHHVLIETIPEDSR